MDKEKIFQILKESFNEIIPDIPVDSIRIEDSLKDLGANSIDRADIIMLAAETLNVVVPMVEFAKARNIGEIVDILYAAKNK
jgi:polyketide biosynthesis acyl carrier protein